MITIHILHGGLPLCRFSTEVPGNWPEGHQWVGLNVLSMSFPEGTRLCMRCAEESKKFPYED
jgi:hypothetical protein